MTDLGALPPAVTLPVGARVPVPLPSYAGSGNTWSARCVRGEGVALVRVHLGATDAGYDVSPPREDGTPGDGPLEPPDAAPVAESAVVEGLSVGEAVWELVLSRAFGPEVPTAVHGLRVQVVPEVEVIGR